MMLASTKSRSCRLTRPNVSGDVRRRRHKAHYGTADLLSEKNIPSVRAAPSQLLSSLPRPRKPPPFTETITLKGFPLPLRWGAWRGSVHHGRRAPLSKFARRRFPDWPDVRGAGLFADPKRDVIQFFFFSNWLLEALDEGIRSRELGATFKTTKWEKKPKKESKVHFVFLEVAPLTRLSRQIFPFVPPLFVFIRRWRPASPRGQEAAAQASDSLCACGRQH